MKYSPILFIASLTAGTVNAVAKPTTVVDFIGGINSQYMHNCLNKIESSSCKITDVSKNYKNCIHKVMHQHRACQQFLNFFQLTNGGLISKLKQYRNISVIRAEYPYVSEMHHSYFIVTKAGEFLSLPVFIKRKTLREATNYPSLAKQYPQISTWQILGFPSTKKLANGQYRLVFTQQLKNGCSACAISGTAQIAYDFSNNGDKFMGIRLLRLTPRKDSKP